VEQVMDEQAGMELTEVNVEQVGSAPAWQRHASLHWRLGVPAAVQAGRPPFGWC
jgi:hypothetical protein